MEKSQSLLKPYEKLKRCNNCQSYYKGYMCKNCKDIDSKRKAFKVCFMINGNESIQHCNYRAANPLEALEMQLKRFRNLKLFDIKNVKVEIDKGLNHFGDRK